MTEGQEEINSFLGYLECVRSILSLSLKTVSVEEMAIAWSVEDKYENSVIVSTGIEIVTREEV